MIAIGDSATNLAAFLNLPIENHLVENGAAAAEHEVLRARIGDARAGGHVAPVAAGMKPQTDFFFDNSPVWKLGPDAAAKGVKPIAWFDSKTPLRSGWAWGQQYLENGVIAVEATVGKGRVLLYRRRDSAARAAACDVQAAVQRDLREMTSRLRFPG